MSLRKCDCAGDLKFDADSCGHEMIYCKKCGASTGFVYLPHLPSHQDAEWHWNQKKLECFGVLSEKGGVMAKAEVCIKEIILTVLKLRRGKAAILAFMIV